MLPRLRHRLRARNRHGVHSPLAYRLVDEVLLRPTGVPVRERIRQHFGDWQWAEVGSIEAARAPEHLAAPPAVVFIPEPHKSETAWLAATRHPAVSLVVDCWDFGLLLATPDVKTPQYFRLRYKP